MHHRNSSPAVFGLGVSFKINFLSYYPHDPTSDKRKKMDGWVTFKTKVSIEFWLGMYVLGRVRVRQ